MDTSWLTGTWIAQTALSGLVGALVGLAVGFLPGRRAAEKSTQELNAVADKLTVEIERVRHITNTLGRALEGTEAVGPLRRTPAGDAVGVTPSLQGKLTGSSGVVLTELGSTSPKPEPESDRP